MRTEHILNEPQRKEMYLLLVIYISDGIQEMPESRNTSFSRHQKKGKLETKHNKTNSAYETTDAQTETNCNRGTAQSDKRFRCPYEKTIAYLMHLVKILIRLGNAQADLNLAGHTCPKVCFLTWRFKMKFCTYTLEGV